MTDPITAFGHFILRLFSRAPPPRNYDPADDARKSYAAAVEAKRLRGDTHWPEQQERRANPDVEAELAALKRALERQIVADTKPRRRLLPRWRHG